MGRLFVLDVTIKNKVFRFIGVSRLFQPFVTSSKRVVLAGDSNSILKIEEDLVGLQTIWMPSTFVNLSLDLNSTTNSRKGPGETPWVSSLAISTEC